MHELVWGETNRICIIYGGKSQTHVVFGFVRVDPQNKQLIFTVGC